VAVQVERNRLKMASAPPCWPRCCVERSSQKGILIGKGGSMLKRCGTGARHQMEKVLRRAGFILSCSSRWLPMAVAVPRGLAELGYSGNWKPGSCRMGASSQLARRDRSSPSFSEATLTLPALSWNSCAGPVDGSCRVQFSTSPPSGDLPRLTPSTSCPGDDGDAGWHTQ